MTKEMCMFAFEHSPYAIQYFPEEYVSEELALKAVAYSGYIFDDLPEAVRTKAVFLAALTDEGNASLEDLPKDQIDKEVCLTWLQKGKRVFRSLDIIPKELRDYDVCLAAVRRDGCSLEQVPAELVDAKICNAAIENWFDAIKFVPQELFTKEMAVAVAERDPRLFEMIPAELLSEELCLCAAGHGALKNVMEHAPKELITQKVFDAAVEASSWAYDDVPDENITFEMVLQVAKDMPGKLYHKFPKRFRTKEIIERIIAEAPRAKLHLERYME